MAEVSKRRGEFGEEIVGQLLSLVGWDPVLKGIDFPCINPMEHARSTNMRTVHGVDFVYEYDCPLFTDTQQFALISSKFNDEYPSNPTSKFKLHLRDIANALECFKKSPIKNQLSNFERRLKKYSGVIFWLDNGKENQYDDVIERLSNFRVESDLEFDSVYLVDNRRADFMYDAITSTKSVFKEGRVEFLIPNTGHNNTIGTRKTSSSVLPLQYINASVLPLKIVQGSVEVLALNVIDEFEADYLRRLISLAQKLTEGWANQVYILFPQYNSDLYGETVKKIKLEFKDQAFVRKVIVNTFNEDFRNVA